MNKTIIIILYFLISIRFWSFTAIPESYFDNLEIFSIISMLFIVFNSKNNIETKLSFKGPIIGIMSFMFLSAIPAYTVHQQSLFLSFVVLRGAWFWLFYFCLHKFNISINSLIKIMTFIAGIWVILLVLQQFTYPIYYFSQNIESITGKSIEVRNGLYRFMTFRHHYAMVLVFYYFYKFIDSKKTIHLLLGFLFLVGLYVFSTRQFLFISLFILINTLMFFR